MYWRNFRKSEYFLLSYLSVHMLFLVLLSLLLASLNFNIESLGFNSSIIMAAAAFLCGLKLPTIMHNAVHRNLSNFNSIIGEFSAHFILISFGVVNINHTFHHAWPDSDKDPHTPLGKSFSYYLLSCLHSGVCVIRDGHYKFHGETPSTKLIFGICVALHYSSIPLRLLTWYFLLGETLFFNFYLVAFATFLFTFAHVNYITHQVNSDGTVIIVNKNSNLWYKFVNLIADGIYFHKNHHINPSAYNPAKLKRGATI